MNKDDLLLEMNGKTTTNGWDVVCAMSAEHISSLFADKYNKQETSGTLYEIKCEEEFELGTVAMDFQLGPPLISFMRTDSETCMLRLQIRTGQADLKNSEGKIVNSQKIPAAPDDNKAYYITCTIPLAVIDGKVKNGHDVVIDFQQIKNVQIDLTFSDMIKDYAVNALKSYFSSNLEKKDWSLGTLIYDQNPQLINLTPKSFQFATSVKDDTDTGCLMLFITLTDGNDGNALEISGKNGRIYAPYPDDHSAALIISSRVLFKTILEGQFTNNFSAGIQSAKGTTDLDAWRLQSSGSIDCGRYNKDQKQDLYAPIDNFKLQNDSQNCLEVSWSESWYNPVQYWVSHPIPGGGAVDVLEDGQVHLNIGVSNPSYTFSITDSTQEISCSSSVSVNVSGDQPSFWDGYGFSNAKNMVQQTVSGVLSNILNFKIQGVSVFAVSNLLFPADHIINYDKDGVSAPGDLVIFGTTKQKLS